MKRIIAGMLLVAFMSVPAIAQDHYKTQNAGWSGFYFGGHLGGGFGDASWGNYLGQFPDHDIDGFVGGLHGGYNFQSGQWVYGIEADFTWADVEGDTTCVQVVICSTTLDYLGSVRGRIGYAWDNFLLFATAGYGYTDVELSASLNNLSASVDGYTDGYVVGGGAEWKFHDNLSARVEALYYEFDYNDPVEFDQTVIRGGLTWHLQ